MTAPEMPTWISCLTPPGQSALATLGLYGPRAWPVLRQLFRRRSGCELPPILPSLDLGEGRIGGGGRFWLGRIGDELADEAVLAVKQNEPVPWLELHAHGGREGVRFLIDLFRDQGLQLCSWEEFLRKTSEDMLSAEAAIELAQTATLRTAAILLDQQQGALRQDIAAILQALERSDTGTAEEGLLQLERYAAVGLHLTQPWRVVVAGAPNVGKSSLVNALAGYQRSIVAATPGTTRDVVTTSLALDGWLIDLADTAGQRSNAEPLEQQGIRQAQSTAASADLCLWLFDASMSPVWPSAPLREVVYVVNKCDLPPAWDLATVPDALRISARTGDGLAQMCEAVLARLIPQAPPPGAAVPFTLHLCERIAEARRQLASGSLVEARLIVAGLCERNEPEA